MKPARHTDGKPYTGNQQFAGNGLQRSCGKCGKHGHPSGGKQHKVYGWLNACCQKEKKR